MKRSDWLLIVVLVVACFTVALNRDYISGWWTGVCGDLPTRTGAFLDGYNKGVLIFNRMVEKEQSEIMDSQ